MDEKHLPVLPLPVFVLPDGKVRLRIFEKKIFEDVEFDC
jgi:Lon protease-like protein